MYTSTRATSTIYVIMVVTTTTLLLVASTTITGSVFAAKTSLSHHSGKSNGKTSSSGNASTVSSGSTTDSTNNNLLSTISDGNPNFDNLLACESTAAHGAGQLTKAEVMNCYLQYSRGSASSLSIIGDSNNLAGNSGGSISGSTSTTHHAGLSTTHTHSHHHGPTNPISPRGNSTSSG